MQNDTTGSYMLKAMGMGIHSTHDVKCVGYKAGSLAVQDMLNGNIELVVIDEGCPQDRKLQRDKIVGHDGIVVYN